jgi:hypothetical protein
MQEGGVEGYNTQYVREGCSEPEVEPRSQAHPRHTALGSDFFSPRHRLKITNTHVAHQRITILPRRCEVAGSVFLNIFHHSSSYILVILVHGGSISKALTAP